MRLGFLVSCVILVGSWGCSKQPSVSQTERPPLITQVPPGSEPEAKAGSAPSAARKYQAALTKNARLIWGMEAPVPMFGAQVEQESGWREDARSHVGAQGLGQFMPATANWIDDVYPDLGEAQPYNPGWSLRALVQYDKHLFDRVEGATECDKFAFALSSYNGGLKWVQRDQAKARAAGRDPLRYWNEVEAFNAGRNASAWTENRGYPRRIIQVLQVKYVVWGKVVCG